MKNILQILSLVIILPISLGDSDSKGCSSKDSDYNNDDTVEQSDKKNDNEKNLKSIDKKPGENDITCHPFNCID